MCLALAACGGGSDDGAAQPAPPAPATLGAAGGTVTGTGGTQLVVPPGALAQNTAIAVALASAGAPALPAGVTAFGPMFAFTPHGTTFALPVTVTVPFDPAAVAVGATPALYKTYASQSTFEPGAGAPVNGASMTAQVTSFSFLTAGSALPLPRRVWEFRKFPSPGQGSLQLPAPDGSDTQIGGLLEKTAHFGRTFFDPSFRTSGGTQQPDGFADGMVFSSAGGLTCGVVAEAPNCRSGPNQPLGSSARLTQTQSFIKRSADASLTFTVTRVFIDASDFNAPVMNEETRLALLISGETFLSVKAYKTSAGPNFCHVSGRASVS